MSGNGFALSEYVAPRVGAKKTVPYGTMAKASTESGSCFGESKRRAQNPGPEKYQQHLDKAFNHKAKGGTFSKLERGFGKSGAKNPAVGQYESASTQCEPKVTGGTLPKTERKGGFENTREGFKQAPGKYDAIVPEKHKAAPQFQTAVTESRVPKKASTVGPGYYNLEYKQVEEKVPCYGGSQEKSKSYLDTHVKGKDKIPGPGHHDIPDSKVHDRTGKRLHSARLVADRIITPRPAVAAS